MNAVKAGNLTSTVAFVQWFSSVGRRAVTTYLLIKFQAFLVLVIVPKTKAGTKNQNLSRRERVNQTTGVKIILSKEQRKNGAERETFEKEKAARALVEELRANAG